LKVRPLGDKYLGKTVSLSMPGYVTKCYNDFDPNTCSQVIARPKHLADTSLHHIYTSAPQFIFIDKTEKLSPTLITELQAIIIGGTLLYYARAVDLTLLTISNELASQQAQQTQRILKAANRALAQLL
jgi:hypothetical protein